MAKFLDGTSLFTGINAGLTNTYSVLSSQFSNGVTLENLAGAEAKTTLNTNSLSPNFKQYLQTNFSSIDSNHDGTISAEEISELTNSLASKGMTREQLSQLGQSCGISGSLLDTVLSHFDEIDANKDGKVTNAEIKAYGVNSAIENQKTKDIDRRIAGMSTFYGDDDASTKESYSLLDYKYLKEDEKD